MYAVARNLGTNEMSVTQETGKAVYEAESSEWIGTVSRQCLNTGNMFTGQTMR
jgi:hypothetical protein